MSNNLTIISILETRAREQGDRLAYIFLENGKTPTQSLTYQQLAQKVSAIASQLQTRVSPNSTVLLLYANNLEFLAAFLGCLAANVIAIPTPALESYQMKRALPRIVTIATDARPTLILTTSQLATQLSQNLQDIPQLNDLEWLRTDKIFPHSEISLNFNISCEAIAYLQYTSGSTSAPKGVMISHQNLIHNLAGFVQKSVHDSTSICATWLPFFHDFGLIYGLLQPLYAGVPCYVMSPFSFLKNPLNWLRAISNYRVTHSAAPNFAFDYCVEKITPKQRQYLNLKSWRVAHTGSETVRPSTLKRFAEAFTSCGFNIHNFYPGYGLAEATLIATTKLSHQKPTFLTVSPQELSQNIIKESIEGISLTGCGLPIQGTDLAIVDRETGLECLPDRVGEIWLSSESIARGYWQKDEETQQTFKAILTNRGEKLFLRTGDLGFIKNGELFIAGRIKELILIRGENYYPQDIEFIVQQSHSQLRSNGSAAFSVEIESKEELIIFQELEKISSQTLEFDAIFTAIREAILRECEISVYGIYLLKRGQLPKTSSGKIQRNTCRQALLQDTVEAISHWTRKQISLGRGLPKTEIESQLLAIFTEILGIDAIGVEDNFFDLGIDSLLFLPLFTRIEEQFEITIDFEKIIEHPTISQFANLITKTPVPKTSEPYPIRINCFKVFGQIYQAKLPRAEKLSRVYDILKIQLSQTGPDFLDYTLPYGIGTRFIHWFCGQKWIQKLFFHDRVKAIEQCLDMVNTSTPHSQSIQHNLMSNFWRYWRLAALASSSPENCDRWISITGLSRFQQAYQQKKGVILLLFHVPLRPLLMLLLHRWGINDFTVIGTHRYTMELLNLSHLSQKMLLNLGEVTKTTLYSQFYQAHQILNRGGIVVIAPDGLRKQPGIERNFFNEKCYIGRNFIDFAISLQSIAIPVDISMELTGVVRVQFLDILDSGNCSLLYEEKVEKLADQYWEILKNLWQDNFGNVGWDGIDAFIEQFELKTKSYNSQ